jgi:hypothetical protein
VKLLVLSKIARHGSGECNLAMNIIGIIAGRRPIIGNKLAGCGV